MSILKIAFILMCGIAFTNAADVIQTESTSWIMWRSGDGKIAFEVGTDLPILYQRTPKGWVHVAVSPLAMGSRRHEYAGPVYFRDATPLWIKDKYLVLEKQDALEIVDVDHSQLILSTCFEAITKHPTQNRWATIQWRAVGRSQEKLDVDYQDDLLLIDPVAASRTALDAKPGSEPLSHLLSCPLDGIALAPARWSRDGRNILCAVWHEGFTQLVTYDGATLKKLSQKELHLKVDAQEVTSIALSHSKMVSQVEQLMMALDLVRLSPKFGPLQVK